MEIISEFKKVAPYIASRIAERVTDSMSDENVMRLIHAEIMTHFANQQLMMNEYLCFNEDQRRAFAVAMYDALLPAAKEVKPATNPLYDEYVRRTGRAGALNFMINKVA